MEPVEPVLPWGRWSRCCRGAGSGVELLGELTARAYAAVGPGLDGCGPDKFDEGNLAFPHQEHKASGEDSTFFKLVSR